MTQSFSMLLRLSSLRRIKNSCLDSLGESLSKEIGRKLDSLGDLFESNLANRDIILLL